MIEQQRAIPLPDWLEQAWLQRYLNRELDAAESEWFETYAIDKPSLIAAIESDNSLRDGLHAWHAQGAGIEMPATVVTASPLGHDRESSPRRNASPRRWLRPFAAAASLAIAAVFGAGAAQWAGNGSSAGVAAVASPRRVVFDTLRGADTVTPLVESARRANDPLLVDVAVPAQAEAVVAHFADGSSLPLDVSSDGFISLVGPAAELQRLSPIRLAWQVNGQVGERRLDLASALDARQR